MSEDVFRWVIAAAVILACLASIWQAVVLAALYQAGKQAAKAGKEAQTKLGPLLDHFESFLKVSGKILEENRPRIAQIVSDTLVIAKTTRQQAEHVSEIIDEANVRVKARIAQIDATVEQTVVQVEQARDAVKTAVMKPAKEVNGIVAGVRAAFNTYAQGGTRNSPEHVTQDEEMFI